MTLRQREPRITDKAFLAFVHTKPCCACGTFSDVQAAHLRRPCLERGKRATGLGERPNDFWSVPLCRGCHLDSPNSLHRTSEEVFFARLKIDPFALAADLYEEFRRVP